MKIFVNLGLMLVAIILFAVLFVPAILASIFSFFFGKKIGEGINSLSKLFLATAISIDQLGNTFCASLFNYTLQKEGYSFGNVDETISGVIGKNKLLGTLTKAGKCLDWILEKIDPNHSIKSIEVEENFDNY